MHCVITARTSCKKEGSIDDLCFGLFANILAGRGRVSPELNPFLLTQLDHQRLLFQTKRSVSGRTLRLVGVTEGDVANYHAERAQIVVERAGSAPLTLYPERRWYPVARSQTTNTAIASNGLADLYLALGDPDGHGGWVLRAYYNPLVPWIWFGAILAALGGLVSLSDRRLRVRLPAGRTSAAVIPAGSAES